MNEFMEIYNSDGWAVFFMSGLTIGLCLGVVFQSICVGIEALLDYIQEKKKK